MREIKFRAWDNNEMLEVRSLEFVPSHKSFNGKPGYNINIHLGITQENLMQFTGLKDKDGKEIYEGDILERSDKQRDIVIFDGGSFCVKHDKGGMDFIAYNNYFEVIGNIWENPGLLKDGKEK